MSDGVKPANVAMVNGSICQVRTYSFSLFLPTCGVMKVIFMRVLLFRYDRRTQADQSAVGAINRPLREFTRARARPRRVQGRSREAFWHTLCSQCLREVRSSVQGRIEKQQNRQRVERLMESCRLAAMPSECPLVAHRRSCF